MLQQLRAELELLRQENQRLQRELIESKETEQELLITQQCHLMIFDDLPEMISRWLPDGTLLFINAAFTRQFDRPKSEIIGRRFPDLVPPDLREITLRGIQEIGERLTPEHPSFSQDARTPIWSVVGRWQRWTHQGIFNRQGKLVEIQSLGHDITAQKEAEERLRTENEERFRLIAELTTHYSYILHVDDSGRPHPGPVTDTFYQILGYSKEELEAHGGLFSLIHPDDQPNIDLSGETLLRGQMEITEFRVITKSGETRWLRDYKIPLWDERLGRVTRIIGAAQDMTLERQREDTIRQKAAFNQGVLSSLFQYTAVLDPQGNFVAANAGWNRHSRVDEPLSHLSRRIENGEQINFFELFGRNLHTSAENQQMVLDGVRTVLDGKSELFQLEYQATLDPQQPWYLFLVTPLKCEPYGVVISVKDITPRKTFEAALAANKKRYKSLLNHFDDVVLQYAPDLTHLFANDAVANILPVSAPDLIGQPPQAFWGSAEIAGEFSQHLQDVFRSGQTREGIYFLQHLPQPLYLHWRLIPEPGPDGTVETVLGHISDITLLEQLARAQRESEERLQARNAELEALNAVIAKTNATHDLNDILETALQQVQNVTGVRAAWVHLLDETSNTLSLAAQHGLSESSLPIDEAIRCDPAYLKWVQGLAAVTYITPQDAPAWVRKDALRDAPYLFVMVPIHYMDTTWGAVGMFAWDPAQTVPGLTVPAVEGLLLSVAREIGVAIHNMRLLDEVDEARVHQEVDRLRAELIANVSHEMRTPLGLIKIFSTTLLRSDLEIPRETQLEFLNDINGETDKLEVIVGNLLDLSQMENQKLRLEKESFDLRHLLEEARSTFAVLAQPGQEIRIEMPDLPLVTLADRKRIEQVLRNLVTNAVKYSPQGGPISIQALGDGQAILVGVQDRGQGIPPEDLERIFQRFYRVNNELASRVSGAGLGLAVCRGIIEAHGGRIWAENRPEGGASLYFTLPVG